MTLSKLGAMWRKQKEGKTYFTGLVEINGKKTNLVMYPNEYKTNKKGEEIENPPAYNIFEISGVQEEKVYSNNKKQVKTTITD